MDILQTPPVVTSNFVYLRLIGDRSISEKDFGKIQKDRVEEIKKWSDRMKKVNQHEYNVKVGIVAANNHYEGFGPGTVNMFREMMDMEQVSYDDVDMHKSDLVKERDQWNDTNREEENMRNGRRNRQTILSDFVE